jgi:hypothetical protein
MKPVQLDTHKWRSEGKTKAAEGRMRLPTDGATDGGWPPEIRFFVHCCYREVIEK